jgi:hypothetical protein
MVRTVISLDEADKQWLDERAAAEGVPMTEIIRRAVRRLREDRGADAASATGTTTEDLLERTRGTWQHGDGLEYQERLRGEW